MNHAQATQFTYRAARRKCPSCGDPLRLGSGYTFCERELGTSRPGWYVSWMPKATRTASPGRFTIAGMDGFWNVLSHMHAELGHNVNDCPGGCVVASLKRYNAILPTAVVFVRQKKRPARKKKRKVASAGRPIGAYIKALEKKRTEPHIACDCARPRGPICFTPGCGRKHFARGLCSACHKSARILIANGGATWGELEDYGLSAPKLHVRHSETKV